jgi:hypothetical protein
VPIRSISRASTAEKFQFRETSRAGLELARMMADVQRGLAPDQFGWCWKIELTEDEKLPQQSQKQQQQQAVWQSKASGEHGGGAADRIGLSKDGCVAGSGSGPGVSTLAGIMAWLFRV